MKFMLMHKHDAKTEAGILPPPELISAIGEFVGKAAQSGMLIDGAGLGASANRSRVRVKGGERTVQHGPYKGGNNELPAGYAVVKVRSRDEALDWAAKIGAAVGGEVELEVGKVNEAWDLGLMEKPADAPLQFLLLRKATPASEKGAVPDLAAVKKQMSDAGVLVSSAELAPSSRGKRLTWRAGNKKVVDGPFAESKELIGGFAVLELPSMEACVAYCEEYARILLLGGDTLEIDIRPL